MKQVVSSLFTAPVAAGLIVAALMVAPYCDNEESPFGPPCQGITVQEGMKCIPGGFFIRGSNELNPEEDTQKKIDDESPEEKVAVKTFFMDTYEVTYSQYQECVKAGACTHAHPNYIGYDRPKQPMLGVTWFQARDYCTWKGKRLPTEAEWEKAARGDKGDIYPWGSEPADCTRAVLEEKGEKGCGAKTTWDVGSKGAFRYGLFDMAGNSWEWVNDWYSANYTKCGPSCKGIDPKGPCGGAEQCPGYDKKVLRGGSWWWGGNYSRGSNRRSHYPANSPFHHLGFRCAKGLDIKGTSKM